MNKIITLLCIILFFGTELLHAQMNIEEMLKSSADSIKKNAIGKEFCNFELITLDKEFISSKDLIGKITLIDFWFGTCSPCIAEIGELIELYCRLKDNEKFQFLSFTTDNPDISKRYVEEYNIPYIVCPISREDAYRMNFGAGFPTKIILDKDGKTIFFHAGGFVDQKRIKQKLKEIEDMIKELL